MIVEGIILRGASFEPTPGRVVVEDGVIMRVEEAGVDSTDIVVPAFVNAHTHIGDSIAKEAGEGLTLEELVAPPDGLKHRLLRAASEAELVAAMRRTVRFMERTGTGTFIDFREGDVAGVRALHRAVEGSSVTAWVLGRGSVAALDAGDGFGASSARDGEFGGMREAARDAGKLFGIHAGERDPDDIQGALDLDPDFIVHMVHPERGHLEEVGSRSIPVVVCPRSNLVTGAGMPPVEELVDSTTVALGTDNVMLNAPSMFREMEFVAKLTGMPAEAVLWMATRAGGEMLGVDCGLIREGYEAKLVVLDGDSDNLAGARDPVRAVVRRAGASDVKTVVS